MYHTSPYHKHNPGTAAYHRKAGKRIAALLFVWVMLVTTIPTGGFTEKSGPVCGLEEHVHTDDCYLDGKLISS